MILIHSVEFPWVQHWNFQLSLKQSSQYCFKFKRLLLVSNQTKIQISILSSKNLIGKHSIKNILVFLGWTHRYSTECTTHIDTNIHKNNIYKTEAFSKWKKSKEKSNEYEVDSSFFYSILGGFIPMIELNLNWS